LVKEAVADLVKEAVADLVKEAVAENVAHSMLLPSAQKYMVAAPASEF